MIARLITWCIDNRLIVLLLTAALAGFGIHSARNITVDAIPDLSDVQVVMRVDYPGQAPQVVQDQVTYPLTTAMMAVPRAEVVRGFSMFGSSFVYILFEDGTDIYWARARVLEQISTVAPRLPDGVVPSLGPDASGVGWIYQYVLTTGPWSPEHPAGLWHDPATDDWFAARADAPQEARPRLERHRTFPGRSTCPLTGEPLRDADVDLARLRSLQDWYLRYELTGLPGVSEVAAVGGFVKQYQIVLDPVRLQSFEVSVDDVRRAVQASNLDVGGGIVELSEMEYMVRGLGYLGRITAEEAAEARERGELIEDVRTRRVLEDLRMVPLRTTDEGTPVLLRDVSTVRTGPEMRRGIAEWNGLGEVVGGIVVMRHGENARDTIERVRERLGELEEGLPPGVAVEVAYDRSDLIERSVSTLTRALAEEILIVSLVTVLFLLHARSAFVAVFVLPTGVLASVAVMHLLGINANIMSLGGIAISIGVMVDSSVIMVENAHKRLEEAYRRRLAGHDEPSRVEIIANAAREVGPTLFFSLLIITVSFLPIFVLGEQSGRLFRPLAFTKTFAMAAAALLAVTIIPVLMIYLIRDRVVPAGWGRAWRWGTYALAIGAPAVALAVAPLERLEPWRWWMVVGWVLISAAVVLPQRVGSEERNPVSRILQGIYDPVFAFVMHFKGLTLIVVTLLTLATLWPLSRLGWEFMPPLEEGDLLYMPTTEPGLGPTKARELLQQTDALIASFPEVEAVFGKIGRAETATDPAPMEMIETTITLRRDKSQWRHIPQQRFYSDWPSWAQTVPRHFWPDVRPITLDELIYGFHVGDLSVPGLNEVVDFPGLTNSWTQPIRTRIDMLATGIRTPVGVKVMGPDLEVLAGITDEVANLLTSEPEIASYTSSAFAERTVGGRYLDIEINREAAARHGLSVADVQEVIATAIGGMNVGETVEGLERYPINIRYPSELRDNLPALRRVLVQTPGGAQVPLGQVAELRLAAGPPMIKSENARLTSWVYVDVAGLDLGSYVETARRLVAENIELPEGYTIVWSGQYEYLERARASLLLAVPLVGVAIVLLLYLATRSWVRVGIILLAAPHALVGAIWLVWLMDYNLSLAVIVGLIALAGLDAEMGLVMLLYLDNSYERFKRRGQMRDTNDLWHAVHEGAVQRIRPKTMTVITTFVALLPLVWADGAGADTMRRLAIPLIGGLASSFLLELLIYPILFYLAKRPTVGKAAPPTTAFTENPSPEAARREPTPDG